MATYRKIGGGYFEDTDKGLQAVGNSRTLGGLMSGDIASTEQGVSGSTFANSTGQPTSQPTTTPTSQPTGQSTTPNAALTSGMSPVSGFNYLLLDLLQRAKGMDNTALQTKKAALQRALIGKQQELTPEELRTLSPAQQASLRSGQVKSLEPELDFVNAQLKDAQTRVDNFEGMLKEAGKLGEDFVNNMEAPDDVVASYVALIENGEAIGSVLSGVSDKTRQEVLKRVDVTKLKKQESGDELLSVGDAQAFGVPYGTKKSEVVGLSPIDKNPTESEQKSASSEALLQSWQEKNLIKQNNKISPSTYFTAREAWIRKYGADSAIDFDARFAPFRNTKDKIYGKIGIE